MVTHNVERLDLAGPSPKTEGQGWNGVSAMMEASASAAQFGCNTYSYMRSLPAAECVARLADLGFREFELMVHPGHLWPAELTAAQRGGLRRQMEQPGVRLVALNMPNIDINVAAASAEMRAYSLGLLTETVRLAGELGAAGVVIGPGKANPLFPADANELMGHFHAALDRLCPVAETAGTALWVENMPFAFLPAIGPLMEALDRYGNDAVRVVYDIANAHFIAEDFAAGLMRCRDRLALVHLSDTGRQVYRHDPVGEGTVPFDRVPPALAAVGYAGRPMLEIVSRDPDRDILASADRLVRLGFAAGTHVQENQGNRKP
jgi:sugar phosphate isomerase/epimerase